MIGDDSYKDKDDSYWVNMVKEADKNGDGEVREITFNLCQD
jgi:hypothetical protein